MLEEQEVSPQYLSFEIMTAVSCVIGLLPRSGFFFFWVWEREEIFPPPPLPLPLLLTFPFPLSPSLSISLYKVASTEMRIIHVHSFCTCIPGSYVCMYTVRTLMTEYSLSLYRGLQIS